jgi:hypothetical protein
MLCLQTATYPQPYDLTGSYQVERKRKVPVEKKVARPGAVPADPLQYRSSCVIVVARGDANYMSRKISGCRCADREGFDWPFLTVYAE